MCGKLKCPRCGSENVVSYGKSAKGRARTMCKACGRTFSRTTGTVMFSQKPRAEKLAAMLNLMVNDAKLKAIEDSVGITQSTAYLWRMKVYTAAKKMHDGIFSHDALVAFVGGASEVHKSTTGEAHAKLQKVNSFIAEVERFVTVHPGLKGDCLDL